MSPESRASRRAMGPAGLFPTPGEHRTTYITERSSTPISLQDGLKRCKGSRSRYSLPHSETHRDVPLLVNENGLGTPHTDLDACIQVDCRHAAPRVGLLAPNGVYVLEQEQDVGKVLAEELYWVPCLGAKGRHRWKDDPLVGLEDWQFDHAHMNILVEDLSRQAKNIERRVERILELHLAVLVQAGAVERIEQGCDGGRNVEVDIYVLHDVVITRRQAGQESAECRALGGGVDEGLCRAGNITRVHAAWRMLSARTLGSTGAGRGCHPCVVVR
mmetsp:Transcript_2297/g.6283  ORF Transcript_2297/g.6283 Transcript_2297/m.6283 type:complete len:273 (-) Transcript_2297:1281-2099(-)